MKVIKVLYTFYKITIIFILNYYFGWIQVLLDHIQEEKYFLSHGGNSGIWRVCTLIKPFV